MSPFIEHPCLVLCREESFSSGPSFKTISASGLNAALAHYRYFRRKNFLELCGKIPVYVNREKGEGGGSALGPEPILNFEVFSTMGAVGGEWSSVGGWKFPWN